MPRVTRFMGYSLLRSCASRHEVLLMLLMLRVLVLVLARVLVLVQVLARVLSLVLVLVAVLARVAVLVAVLVLARVLTSSRTHNGSTWSMSTVTCRTVWCRPFLQL